MKKKKFLPVGTVVTLIEEKEQLMIIGFCQKNNKNDRIWDYVGVVYPIGYISFERMILFDSNQIGTIHFIGCQDETQLSFSKQFSKYLEEETLW